MAIKQQSLLVDRIYEAVFIPDNWERVLNDMARSIGAEGTVMFNSRDVYSHWVASQGVMDLIDQFIAEGWAERNARGERLLGVDYQGFLNEAEVFSEEEYRTFPVYTELLSPNGFGFGAGTVIKVPSGDNIVFSVEKKRSTGVVTEDGIAFLDGLRPHLARASLLTSRLEFERISGAVHALELTGLPSAILTSGNKVLACNDLFERMTAQVKVTAGKKLRFTYAKANQCLVDAAEEIRMSNSFTGRSFALPRMADAAPAIVHLLPVNGGARDIFTRASFFMIVTAVDKKYVPSAETIQGLFDLTPTEASVARSLVAGVDVSGIAASRSLSPETIRTHVKSILSKAGMKRQVDFVTMVSTVVPLESNDNFLPSTDCR